MKDLCLMEEVPEVTTHKRSKQLRSCIKGEGAKVQ